MFIQPLHQRHNKNVWENCAIILAEKPDEEIAPYLYKLFDWALDMNWPGAYCILNKLKSFNDKEWFNYVLNDCINKATLLEEDNWLNVLKSFDQEGQ